ncbi:cytochrome o ubiquinol oxidase subunit IV [Pseudorhodobacter sp.]|uniref:cytochrome o ubiquinol oxidase subunit IV n=1 Tax=Pseudorhodobacter sp. TaxID=1934400 RepID=UPI002647C6BE|nr:cytochrome o ubiquinol oxidase subunit IV [Pseudorhodobacter sp.]MDN5787247.1 cytochrome o ubiquinol oxidase subunit IV [Pseudorhodobacter sp.]
MMRKTHHRSTQESQEFRSYVWGISLAIALTLIPFALVNWHVVSKDTVLVTIAVLAIIQIAVHFRLFLHIDLSKQKREDLHLILFTTLVLALMAGGTIWIMANLAMRMAPMGMP